MIIKEMPAIDAAIQAESWEWLSDNLPLLADAVQKEVARGASPDQVRQYVLRRVGLGREALALRCSQAAAHLAGVNAD